MKIEFLNSELKSPKVSFVLLDWSCRESFHGIEYFNHQTTPRSDYEIIWIEYFSRKAEQIEIGLEKDKAEGNPPRVDQWLIMEMPEDLYYHKHLMYNLGIVSARGEIVVLCDSDVMLRPSFVETILQEFEDHKEGIVLHLDEVRSVRKEFYPFNHPTIDQVMEGGCINWSEERKMTTGLIDAEDRLHTLNYGACMAARREDLISIGGADQHIDYLGHICGPYEMTFRLVNFGLKEIWCEKEFLYHTWHPGTDGKGNYLGPHDGFNMSSTALGAIHTERVFPLLENPSILSLRTKAANRSWEGLVMQTVSETPWREWTLENLEDLQKNFKPTVSNVRILVGQFFEKTRQFIKKNKTAKDLFRGLFVHSFHYIGKIIRQSRYNVKKCSDCIESLEKNNIESFALFGRGEIAETLYELSQKSSVQLTKIFEVESGKSFYNLKSLPLEQLKEYQGIVILGHRENIEENIAILKRHEVPMSRIILLI